MSVTTQMLIDAGFEVIAGADTTLRKRMQACEMPYFNEHVVDEVNIGPQDLAVLTVSADRMVEFSVFQSGSDHTSSTSGVLYHEPPVSIDSEEGLGMLGDAGVQIGQVLEALVDGFNLVQLPDLVDRFEAPVDVSRLPVFGAVQPFGLNPHEKI
ncbi:hypothetical protein [Pseudomonas serbica]|uniref:hypothetical protein n=1 Tax=Pseudomonas serbica TaxID=2965074 RepID=UPI00237C3916|nr:hypothetical protein [Pseudomonas serbica]